jgi:hypothetical protein
MREINKIAEGLFEKIRDRFEDVSLGDENAKATTDPEKARFFNFDYTVDGKSYGNITLSVIDETSLKVYFSKNISDKLDKEEQDKWYAFLRELREFARRNLLSFEPRDITRSTLKHRDIQQVSKADSTYSKDEVIGESRMYGTLKRSYESFGPVRIKLQHTKPIVDEAHGARSRNIAAVFVENGQGERFRLPFTNLTGARAMARHVSAGGVPTDELGCHITEMVNEMATLRPFVINMRHRTFEDSTTNAMIESAFGYHALLKNTLKKMKGKRGYTEFKENFKPTLAEDNVDASDLKELFVKKTLDERIEQALPLVQKAYSMMKENNNPFAQQFENWAGAVVEGTWAFPETDDKDALIDLLSNELPVGVDAQNATNALYDIFGDDKLFDALQELAEVDPQADARDIIMDHLQDKNPQLYQSIIDEIGDQDIPAEPAEPSEEDMEEGNTYGQGMPGGTENMLTTTMEEKEECKYCGGDCPHDEEHACDGYLGDIDDLYKDEVKEAMNPDAKVVYKLFGKISRHEDEGFEMLDSCPVWTQLWDATDGDVKAMLAKATPRQLAAMKNELTEVIEELLDVFESKDKITYDPKTGKLTGWEHEGDWEKAKGKDPVGKIHHMSDVALKRTEKLSKDEVNEDEEDDSIEAIQSAIIRRIINGKHHELLMKLGPAGVSEAVADLAYRVGPVDEIGSSDVSIWVRELEQDAGVEHEYSDLHEAFEQALNEGAINVGDKVSCPDGKTGTVTGDADGYYHVKGDDGETYSYRMQEVKPIDEEITMPDNPDYSKYDEPTFKRQQPKTDKQLPGWAGHNLDEPAYKRKAQYDQEREHLKKLAGLK